MWSVPDYSSLMKGTVISAEMKVPSISVSKTKGSHASPVRMRILVEVVASLLNIKLVIFINDCSTSIDLGYES